MIKALLTASALVLSTGAPAFTALTIDPASPDTIELLGPVSFRQVSPLVDAILDRAGKTKEITMVINSPGGEVMSGLHLINVMQMAKSRGTKFRCVSTFLAASMAMQIFAACDSRYALNGTYLLFHPVRVSFGGGLFGGTTTLTPRLAKDLYIDLERLEKILVSDLRTWLPMKASTFFHHYHAETFWLAKELDREVPNWLTVVDDIVGVKTLDMDKSNKDEAEGRFNYIWSGTGVAL